jgi:hypothetical protein
VGSYLLFVGGFYVYYETRRSLALERRRVSPIKSSLAHSTLVPSDASRMQHTSLSDLFYLLRDGVVTVVNVFNTQSSANKAASTAYSWLSK